MHISSAMRSVTTAYFSCYSLANPFDVSLLSLMFVVGHF